MPEGYARRTDATPIAQTFGLSQRSRLQDASIGMYQDALERLMRPRLILSLEQQIQKNIDNPIFVYEALKVYLMLGGKAPRSTRTSSCPGSSATGRSAPSPARLTPRVARSCSTISRRCSTWIRRRRSKVSLNGPLVEQAQATLARMPVAERAYALLKSQAHNDGIPDWVAANHGGPDMALVYEAANGAGLDTSACEACSPTTAS